MRAITAALSASLLLASAAPAWAHPTRALDPTMPTDVTFTATDNVEYLGRFPEHTGTAGGRLVGDVFFLTDPRGVHAYDVSDPASPQLLGSLPLPQRSTGVALAQEDVDTDGRILLVDAVDPEAPAVKADLNSGTLQVVDVRDPAAMTVIGTADVADHTWTCVSAREPGPRGRSEEARGGAARVTPPGARDRQAPGVNRCAYAYGRSGHIVDLTDPTQPQVLERTWREAVGYGGRGNDPYTHDLTEIRPGLVMSAGSTNILMDTSDPAQPVELTRVEQTDRFPSLGYHSVEWPNGGEDPIAVFGTEIAPSGPTNLAGSDCDGSTEAGANSVIEAWDAGAVADALERYEDGDLTAAEFRELEFTRLDAFDAGGRGIFLDGQAPGHVLYCAHWMELHPDFDGGGLMVASYYDRGTRFVDIDLARHHDGDETTDLMEEIGWITPAEGYSGSAQWVGDEVVYIMDYRRGLEIVRLLDAPATGVYSNGGVDVIAAGSSIQPLQADQGLPWPAFLAVGIVAALLAGEAQRRWRPASART